MNCSECKERLSAYIEGLIEDAERGDFEEHLNKCALCTEELKEFRALHRKLTESSQNWRQTDLENEVINRVVREQNNRLKEASRVNRQLHKWRIIMHSRITKFATAAVIAIAAVLGITFLGQSVPVAYALEQTIQANHSVRFLHIKDFEVGQEEPKEFWVACDESGQIKNARMNFPDWASGGDGAKNVVWNEGKTEVYFLRKNGWLIFNDQTVAQQMLSIVEKSDPRFAIQRLQQLQSQGQVDIEIETPENKAELITVTATYMKNKERQVLFVDQATKLVTSAEFYEFDGGEYVHHGTTDYLDYNQQIDPNMFTLENEVPDDVVKTDQTIQEVGLVQGDMTNDEVAVEVARQFFEAMIAKDYAKAGKLLGGMPGDAVEKLLGHIRFIRIISVGKPIAHPNPATRGVVVPCTVEIEVDGKIGEQKFNRLGVRQVYNQPGRWTIFGGV